MNETLKRAISGLVYIVLLIGSIQYQLLKPEFNSFFILFGVFLLIAVYEFCNLVSINKIIPILIAAILYSGYSVVLTKKIPVNVIYESLFLFATLYVSIKAILFLFNEAKTELSIFNKSDFLLGYVILPFLIIAKIPFGKFGYNPKIIITIFIIIWTNDTFAYIVGKSIGKHKLFERISPKKTIEGFIGGVLFAVLASYLSAKYFIEGSIYIWMIIAVIVGVFGTIGDLIESKFKRIAGVKDSGKIMPGHGGILDRLDSVIFAAPFVYLFYQILYYVS